MAKAEGGEIWRKQEIGNVWRKQEVGDDLERVISPEPRATPTTTKRRVAAISRDRTCLHRRVPSKSSAHARGTQYDFEGEFLEAPDWECLLLLPRA